MSVIDVMTSVDLGPAELAELFWEMDASQQADFFAKLDEIAGYKLCVRMADRTAVSELIEIASLVSASLQERIDANNAMTPQAVMTRRLAAAIAKATGEPA